MERVIYSDLNTRITSVEPQDKMTVVDAKAVVQSLNRLLNVQEGSIPYYRAYGLDLKQFHFSPMDSTTAQEIYEYVANKIRTYETRVEIIEAFSDAIMDEGIITLSFSCRITATGEIVVTDNINIPVGN